MGKRSSLHITSILNTIFLVIWPNVTLPLVGMEAYVSGSLNLALANVLWQKYFVLAVGRLLVDKQ